MEKNVKVSEMSLLDLLSGLAMAGFLASRNPNKNIVGMEKEIAEDSYIMARHLMRVLEHES